MKFLNFFLRMNSLFNRNMTLNCLWIVLFIFLFPGFLVSLYHNQIVVISLLMRPSKGRSDKQRDSINRQESSHKTPTTDRNWQKKWQFVTGTIQHFSSLEMYFTKFFYFSHKKWGGDGGLANGPSPCTVTFTCCNVNVLSTQALLSVFGKCDELEKALQFFVLWWSAWYLSGKIK